jgi:soluble lytic murein transglycosylase
VSTEPDIAASAYYEMCRYFKSLDKDAEYEATIQDFSERFSGTLPYKRLKWENEWAAFLSLPSDMQSRVLRSMFPSTVFTKISGLYGRLGGINTGIKKYPMSFYVDRVLRSYFNEKSLYATKRSVVYLQGVYRAGFREEAKGEAAFEAWRYPNSTEYVYVQAKFLSQEGRHFEAIQLIRRQLGEVRVAHGDVGHDMVKLLYPRPYWGEVTRYASAYRVDPYLILAMMRAGTYFDPKYRVNSGRMGVMQLMPKTAWDVMVRQGKRWQSEDILFRPSVSIDLGTFYMAWLLGQFDGRIHEALAAYHQDPLMVKTWSKQFGSGDFTTYLENVPFLPARDYIRRVMDDYLIYKMIY